MRTRERIDPSQLDLKDNVVQISRVTKVVKGGKNLSFSALVVVGDGHGVVGFGIGKAKEVPSAIKKGIEAAKKNLIRVPLAANTIPHRIVGKFGAGSVLLKPAPDGTGIIAGGAVRAVVEAAGIGNIVTKSLGSANAHNVVRATCPGARLAEGSGNDRPDARQFKPWPHWREGSRLSLYYCSAAARLHSCQPCEALSSVSLKWTGEYPGSPSYGAVARYGRCSGRD